jgi:hypothetical protein
MNTIRCKVEKVTAFNDAVFQVFLKPLTCIPAISAQLYDIQGMYRLLDIPRFDRDKAKY